MVKMYDKCEGCLNSRPIISENGYHYNCTLSFTRAWDCYKGVRDYSVYISYAPKEREGDAQ